MFKLHKEKYREVHLGGTTHSISLITSDPEDSIEDLADLATFVYKHLRKENDEP